MTAKIDMTGVFLPMTTPFDQSGNLDLNNFTKNMQTCNKYDFKGVVVASKTGESPYLTDEERVKLVQTAKQTMKPGRVLIAGAGHSGTMATIHLCNQMGLAGAQAALVHPPRPFLDRQKPEGWMNHFREVADHSRIPIIIYNIPTYTATDLDAKTLTMLAAHENIIGVCDASENVTKIREVITNTKTNNFKVWAGTAHCMTEYAQAGACGCMPCVANVMPTECLQIWAMACSGKHQEAQQAQERLKNFSMSMKRTYGPSGLKYLMDKQQGQFYGGPVRSPLMPLTNEERQTMESEHRRACSTN